MNAWTRGLGITHEPHPDAPDRPACYSRERAKAMGFDLAAPGQSTCGRSGCRDTRMERRGTKTPPVSLHEVLNRLRTVSAERDRYRREAEQLRVELLAAVAKRGAA